MAPNDLRGETSGQTPAAGAAAKELDVPAWIDGLAGFLAFLVVGAFCVAGLMASTVALMMVMCLRL